MKIGIDARTYFLRSGIGRYCRNTCDAIVRLAPETPFSWLISNQKTPKDFDSHSTNRRLSVTEASLNDIEAEARWLASDMRGTGADCAWFPSFTVPEALGLPSVVTVHDMTVFLCPDHHQPDTVAYVARSIEVAARRADRILVDSISTQRDLLDRLPWLTERVDVAYPGVDTLFFQNSHQNNASNLLQKLGIQRGSYFLYIGSIEPRKNLERLIEAYATCAAAEDIALVLGGLPRWKSEGVLERAAAYKGPGRILLPGFVADDELPQLYADALAFVYPSLYEGFGLPPLEAMACGTPVITARNSSLPEVTGEAALYTDAENTEELASILDRIATDSALRRNLSVLGRARAAEFTWDKTATCVLGCLKTIGCTGATTLG
jgi:glycosyltransferase involved in cell wall biosynthesis